MHCNAGWIVVTRKNDQVHGCCDEEIFQPDPGTGHYDPLDCTRHLGFQSVDSASGSKTSGCGNERLRQCRIRIVPKAFQLNKNLFIMKSLSFIRRGKLVFAEPHDIIRFEARSNYTYVYFKDQPPLLMCKVLRIYDELLRPHGFIRTHRSHLINTDYVNDFDRKGIIHMKDSSHAEIARSKRREVFQLLCPLLQTKETSYSENSPAAVHTDLSLYPL